MWNVPFGGGVRSDKSKYNWSRAILPGRTDNVFDTRKWGERAGVSEGSNLARKKKIFKRVQTRSGTFGSN